MPGLSRLILADTDEATRAAVRFAFEREGIEVAVAESPAQVGDLVNSASQLLIVGDRVADEPGTRVLESVRGASKLPALFLGASVDRDAALGAGADQYLPRPAYARDVVTLGRVLAGRKDPAQSLAFACELSELYGLYYVIRALAAARWRGVLTLVRGLRRGELRLYDGEVTSAQVGVLHGLAALHQLLLWSSARMELRVEDVVRRRQIPLDPGEVLADAERFLVDMHRAAGGVSPSSVYEHEVDKIKQLPDIVEPVVRLFDGNRTVADVTEDSPYRVLETLQVIARLAEIGAIRKVGGSTRRSGQHAALGLEEWLVGREPAVPAVMTRVDSQPVGPEPGEPASPPKRGKSGRRKKKRRRRGSSGRQGAQKTGAAGGGGALPDTDWAALVPSAMSGELPGYAAVVPSVNTAGEIGGGPARPPSEQARVELERERLEEVTDADARSRMFGDDTPAPQQEAAKQEAAKQEAPKTIHDLDTDRVKRVGQGQVAGELEARDATDHAVDEGDSIVIEGEEGQGDAVRGRRAASEPKFSDEEEAFFREGLALSDQMHKPEPGESFDDLETEAPKTFWQRLLSRPDEK